MEFSLLAAALTAVGAGGLAVRLTRPEAPDHPFDRLIGAGMAGMFAGWLHRNFATGINLLDDPGQLVLIRGGVETVTASLVFVAVLALPRRSPAALDGLAVPVLASLAGWQAGCLWRGACLGASTTLPWGWALPGSAVDRHPVELYAAALLLAGAVFLGRMQPAPGVRTGLAVLIAAGSRLLTEPLRPTLGHGRSWFYAAAAIVGLAATTYAWIRARSLRLRSPG
ncbi:MAG: prolipoprotein diacylglyceryl transferase family protein [Actinomycetota bacterium]